MSDFSPRINLSDLQSPKSAHRALSKKNSHTSILADADTVDSAKNSSKTNAGIFMDFSKKFLSRVNSDNQHTYYHNLKRNFKSRRQKRKPNNTSSTTTTSATNATSEKDFLANASISQKQHCDSTHSINHLFDRNSSHAENEATALPNGAMQPTAGSSLAKRAIRMNNQSSSIGSYHHLKSDSLSTPTALSPTLKEFEKALINLPTFTLFDENSIQAFLPNALSNSPMTKQETLKSTAPLPAKDNGKAQDGAVQSSGAAAGKANGSGESCQIGPNQIIDSGKILFGIIENLTKRRSPWVTQMGFLSGTILLLNSKLVAQRVYYRETKFGKSIIAPK